VLIAQGADADAAGVEPEPAKGDASGLANWVAGDEEITEGNDDGWGVAWGVDEAAAVDGKGAKLGEAPTRLSVRDERCLGGM